LQASAVAKSRPCMASIILPHRDAMCCRHAAYFSGPVAIF
jgi:hypothetical protein